jgi:hypothetical protein
MAISAWRQSASAVAQVTAISRAFSRSSLTKPSGSLGALVSSSSSRSSLTARSASSIAARFSTVNIASSTCDVVSRWFTLRAMSSASAITCAKSVLSTMGGRSRLDKFCAGVHPRDHSLKFSATGRDSRVAKPKRLKRRQPFEKVRIHLTFRQHGEIKARAERCRTRCPDRPKWTL